jgi:hypothetical protein
MRIHKIMKDGLSSGPLSPVNEIRLSELYPEKRQGVAPNQVLLGLKNQILTFSKAFKNVDFYAPMENIRAVGLDPARRVASFVVLNSVKWEHVEETLRALVESKKTDLAPNKLQLALDVLKSAISQRQSASSTPINS